LPDATDNADAAHVERVAHVALRAGRLLLLNGADTEQVQQAVTRLAAAFGCDANLMPNYETLLLTIVAGEHFRTKLGHHIPAMGVGMSALEAISHQVDEAERGQCGLAAVEAALDAVEHRPPTYGPWLVVAALGLTAASLSRLFGGDWLTFGVTGLAGAAGTWLRLQLVRRQSNPIFVPFAAACLGGVVGGLGARLGLSGTPALCLVAPGMILVPGVPLINSVQDLIRNHIIMGVSRLTFAGMVTVAIALGLFVATMVTGASIPVDAPSRVVGIPEDAVFSALAAMGYATLFNVPGRMGWACVLCGVASHTTRTLCVHWGLDITSGTLVGALFAGVLAQCFARYFSAPVAAFAFPGVVAMVPGAYAFRAVIGSLQIAHGGAPPLLVTETLALGITVMLMVVAIAIGSAAPILLFAPARGQPAVPPRSAGC
jgi:uncharacterized membrane protein YjjP (DUF1212 family)